MNTNLEYLKVEYEQTIQTLRNWDTLFFNAFTSIFIGGGIGSFAAFLGKEKVDISQIRLVLFALTTCIYLVVLMYILYNRFVARKKFEVLRKIEKQLNMVGAYSENEGKIKKFLNYLIFPLLTIVYVISLSLIKTIFT